MAILLNSRMATVRALRADSDLRSDGKSGLDYFGPGCSIQMLVMNRMRASQNTLKDDSDFLVINSPAKYFPRVGCAPDAVRRTEQIVHDSKLLIEQSDRVIQRLRLLDCS